MKFQEGHLNTSTETQRQSMTVSDWWAGGTAVDALGKGRIRVPSRMEWDDTRCHLKMSHDLKCMSCLFLEFPINIFRPQLTVGNWNLRTQHRGWETTVRLRNQCLPGNSDYRGVDEGVPCGSRTAQHLRCGGCINLHTGPKCTELHTHSSCENQTKPVI